MALRQKFGFDPPPAPPPVGLIAYADMEDGTTGPYVAANGLNTGSQYISIINDPVGAFGGKVMQAYYVGGGGGVDLNRSVTWTVPISQSINTLGGSFHMAADIYVPAPPDPATWSAMRKLLYINPSSGISGGLNVVWKQHGLLGTGEPAHRIELQPDNDGSSFLSPQMAFAWNEKHHWELGILFNSALDATDGGLRLWKDGVLIYERLNWFPWLRSTTGTPGAGVRSAKFGEQYQGSLPTDEVRYFDRMALSHNRIGA